jgi:hypothetical protein
MKVKLMILSFLMIAGVFGLKYSYAQQDTKMAMEKTNMTMPDLKNWPEPSQKAAKEMMDKYGKPTESSESMLMWRNAGPFVKIVLTNKVDDHQFPVPHPDVLEYFVNYKVPVDKVDEIMRSDGSITVHRTEGMLSARCDKDASILIGLNCAHDVATGKLNAEQARELHAELAMKAMKGEKPDYSQKLMFTPEAKAGDPDKPYEMK